MAVTLEVVGGKRGGERRDMKDASMSSLWPSMFKGPSVRGSLAGTGLKVRVSAGFKRPSRQGMPLAR